MRVTVNGVRLYFDVEGCGLTPLDTQMIAKPTIVLLPGGPGADHSFFKPEFSAMADAAQVVYLDPRGSGRSDHGDPDMWTWEQWADDVAAFCRALDIEAPVLVGTSCGGRVAVTCAVRHPGLPGRLVLDSTLFGPGSLDDSLAVFERRGGPVAREAAARNLIGAVPCGRTSCLRRCRARRVPAGASPGICPAPCLPARNSRPARPARLRVIHHATCRTTARRRRLRTAPPR